MQVRVFESVDMASGLKMIRKELGPDALILSTRTIRSGKLGLLGKQVLEITAAIDHDDPQSMMEKQAPTLSTNHITTQTENSPQAPAVETVPPNLQTKKEPRDDMQPIQQDLEPPLNTARINTVIDDPIEDFLSDTQEIFDEPPAFSFEPQRLPVKEQNKDTELLRSEVCELKDLVKNMASQMADLSEQQSKQSSKIARQHAPANTDSSRQSLPNRINLLQFLMERGINGETSETVAQFLVEQLSEAELANPDLLTNQVIPLMSSLIEAQQPPFGQTESQQRIALVGPTGVGKTTTIAKIAASYLSNFSSSVALITIDTYRIAAVEQLKVYAEIMRLPVEVVITPEQLSQAIEKHKDKELILIDTAGRNPRDTFCIDELANFFSPELGIEKHLVLSAATRENELLDTIEQFNTLNISNTIFTKTDECSTLGVLLNVQLQNPNPLSYITNGQRVPEDIVAITPTLAAELIMSQEQGFLHD